MKPNGATNAEDQEKNVHDAEEGFVEYFYRPLPPMLPHFYPAPLARRLHPETLRPNSLSLAPHGQLLVMVGSNLSVLSPQVVLRTERLQVPNNDGLGNSVQFVQVGFELHFRHEVLIHKNEEFSETPGSKVENTADASLLSETTVDDGSTQPEKKGSVPGKLPPRKDTISGDEDIAGGIFAGIGWLIIRSGCVILLRISEASWGVGNCWPEEELLPKEGWQCITSTCSNGNDLFIIGGRRGAFVVRLENHFDDNNVRLAIQCQLSDDNCTAVAAADEIWVDDKEYTLVACSLGMGEVGIYDLQGTKLWQLKGFRFPVVSCLQWAGQIVSGTQLALLISGGNGVMVVEWQDITAWKDCEKHCLPNAHKDAAYVAEAALCIDGSVITAGLDGDMKRWRFSRGEGRCTAECHMVQVRSNNKELVMSCVPTMNGFGVFSQTTSRKRGVEARGEDELFLPKFSKSARRTIVNLYILPELFGDVEQMILGMVDQLSQKEHATVCMWDLELFLDARAEESDSLVERIGQQLEYMLTVHSARDEPRASLYYQRARVLYCLCGVVLRFGNGQFPAMDGVQRKLRLSLLYWQYTKCLLIIQDSSISVKKLSFLERQAMESMCQFVSSTSNEFILSDEKMDDMVVLIRETLMESQTDGPSLTSMCSICSPAIVPLVSDAHEAGTYYCLSGDSFPRCVMTGLAVSSVLPLECVSCGGRGVVLKYGDFGWLWRRGYCSICNSRLLLSNGEMVY